MVINNLIEELKTYIQYTPNKLYYLLLNKRLRDVLYRYEQKLKYAYDEIDNILENQNILNVMKEVNK